MNPTRVMLAVAGVVFAVAASLAAQSVAKTGDVVKASVTIRQIDATSRMVTFVKADGTEDMVRLGPAVTRFNELKVGDKVNLTYYESMVLAVRKPGEPPLAVKPSGSSSTPTPGAMPGGTIAEQRMTTVTVKSVDAAKGILTVMTNDGHTVTRKVDDKSRLQDVKAGDQIDIVYTEALVTSVERP